jgi:2-(3-amino-3-carboxypropyl)histidine synthase
MDGMEDTASRPAPRQPKKRFVGRRTADAQAQTDSTNTDTSIEKGELKQLRNEII